MSYSVMSCFNMLGTNRHEQKKLSFKETKICSVVIGEFILIYLYLRLVFYKMSKNNFKVF